MNEIGSNLLNSKKKQMELKECTFHPETHEVKREIFETAMTVKGIAPFKERMEKARQSKVEEEERFRKRFNLEDKWRNDRMLTEIKPFNLSKVKL